ncbi:hypothetical protein GCM10025868_11760 [Angustibacter aerolatus]|uniref:ABC transmembrane type-1 domain-containing protein n=1 Tax=Angustibacter aerolatus TaxID=1162965 RepID=A0ABQ6JGL3_9ACTN|nr:hypothetical protein GCM10025868_11760 [Angustibacter aerolatus]
MATATATTGRDTSAAPTANKRSGGAGRTLRYVGMILLALLFVSPLLFMLITSFKTRAEAAGVPPTWWPHPSPRRPTPRSWTPPARRCCAGSPTA